MGLRLTAAFAAILGTTTAPSLTQEEHIRLNLETLLWAIFYVVVIVVVVLLLNRRMLKRRYAAQQAKLVAEGRADRSNVLAEIANNPPTRFANDDEAAPSEEGRTISIFGDNYRPYGDDGMNAPGA